MPSFNDKSKVLKTIANMKEEIEIIEDSINGNMNERDISLYIDRLERQARELKNCYK